MAVPRLCGLGIERQILAAFRQELGRLVPLPLTERRMLILAHIPDAVRRAARQVLRVASIVGARLRQGEQRIPQDTIQPRREPRAARPVPERPRPRAGTAHEARRRERDDILRLHELQIELAAVELRRAVHIIDFLAARRPRERRETHRADGEAQHAERAQAEREEFALDGMKHKICPAFRIPQPSKTRPQVPGFSFMGVFAKGGAFSCLAGKSQCAAAAPISPPARSALSAVTSSSAQS